MISVLRVRDYDSSDVNVSFHLGDKDSGTCFIFVLLQTFVSSVRTAMMYRTVLYIINVYLHA